MNKLTTSSTHPIVQEAVSSTAAILLAQLPWIGVILCCRKRRLQGSDSQAAAAAAPMCPGDLAGEGDVGVCS
jgi:hypothetical protein